MVGSYAVKKLPKSVEIDVPPLSNAVKTLLSRVFDKEELIDAALPILLEEVGFWLISDKPELLIPEFDYNLANIMTTELTPDHYSFIKNNLTDYYLKDTFALIDSYRCMWCEHCQVELTWAYNFERTKMFINFRPKPSDINLEKELTDIIDRMVDKGEFIPYKFLRVIGRL